MSSDVTMKNLTSDELGMLQQVLSDAGYTGDMLFDQPRTFNAAALLLIQLFQEGTTLPAELASGLDRHFGKAKRTVAMPPTVAPFHRFAIQGLPSSVSGIVH
ncbi:hypothetical protein AM571_CH01161 [Rhizobium etli 8C-3]|uniref:Uncharacterized protein n=2 Tax=Rhizobium TaxID=379 RepID=A0A1L5P1J1_RHIET|nr:MULTISPECIES: hypothetical protein [Rhizobium]APO73998.1 hypothetical protein AM571_CH01161 [Rhizobium etli 8C-3]TCU34439.1 hypothetical protein EV129_11255 [Rhizobium azibense]